MNRNYGTGGMIAVLFVALTAGRYGAAPQHEPNPPGSSGKAAAAHQHASSTTDYISDTEPEGRTRGRSELERVLEIKSSSPCPANIACPSPLAPPPRIVFMNIPDPVHTQLGMQFDRQLDALQDAAQDAGYTYRSWWLPWDSKSHEESTDFKDRGEERLYKKGLEAWPGVVTFSKESKGGPGHPLALVVFLIGETPTRGINAEQWSNAALVARELDSAVPSKVDVLGPTFSGSLPGLQRLLKEEGIQQTVIASGTVSKPGAGKDFTSFESFEEDDECLEYSELDFLHERGVPANRVVDLSESETAYGNDTASAQAASDNDACRPKSGDGRPAHLQFPRGIASLRAAYAQNSVFGFSGKSSSGTNTKLPLSFSGEGAEGDTLPDFSVAQMDVSKDAQLGQIARFLDDNQIEIVLLSATDNIDILFMIRFLHQNAPNVSIVMQGSDTLVLRNGAADINNVYIASTYPLISENAASWSGVSYDNLPPLRLYPDSTSEGTYNAARYLLCEDSKNSCAGPQLPYMRGYRNPFDESKVWSLTRPPLWISAIGRGGFWGVAVLDIKDKDDHLPPLPTNPGKIIEAGTRHLSFLIFMLPLSVVVVLFARHTLLATILGRWGNHYALTDVATRDYRLLLQMGMAAALMLITVLLLPEPIDGMQFYSASSGMWCFLLQIILAFIFIFRLAQLAGWPNPLAAGGTMICCVAAGVALGAIVHFAVSPSLWNIFASERELHHQGTLFRMAASHPLSGVSPILSPLLLIAGLLFRMRDTLLRMEMSGSVAPQLPTGLTPEAGVPSQASVAGVRKWLRLWGFGFVAQTTEPLSIVASRLWLLLAVIGLAVPLWCYRLFRFHTLSGGYYNACIATALWISLAVLLYDLVIAILAWRALQQTCLQPLERSVLRIGFNYVQGHSWKRLVWSAQSPTAQYKSMQRALETASIFAGGNFQTRKLVLDRQAALGNALVSNFSPNIIFPMFEGLQLALAQFTGEVIGQEAVQWKIAFKTATASDEKVTDERLNSMVESDPQAKGQEFCALTYVHFFQKAILQIRRRFISSTVIYLCLVGAISSYPILERHLQMVFLTVLLGVIAAATILVYREMHCDSILSRTTETTPGKLESDFYIHIVGTLGLPVLGLLATQFPELSNFLLSWVEPQLGAFK